MGKSTCQRSYARAQRNTAVHTSSSVEGFSKKTVQNNGKGRLVGIAVEKIDVELKGKKFNFLIFYF